MQSGEQETLRQSPPNTKRRLIMSSSQSMSRTPCAESSAQMLLSATNRCQRQTHWPAAAACFPRPPRLLRAFNDVGVIIDEPFQDRQEVVVPTTVNCARAETRQSIVCVAGAGMQVTRCFIYDGIVNGISRKDRAKARQGVPASTAAPVHRNSSGNVVCCYGR